MLVLRLASADVLPFDLDAYGRSLHSFLEDVGKIRGAKANLRLRELHAAVEEFRRSGEALNKAKDFLLLRSELPMRRSQAVNEMLMSVEGNWLNPDGIPGRPWYKHLLYASRYTYAHLELPGLTEAAENADWKTAGEQAVLVRQALTRNTAVLHQATAILNAGL